MVSEQAIGVGVSDGHDVLGVQAQEMMIIAFCKEDRFTVVAPVIDVITLAVFEGDRFCFVAHGTPLGDVVAVKTRRVC